MTAPKNPRPTNPPTSPNEPSSAGTTTPPTAANEPPTPLLAALRLADPSLFMAAEILDDLERTRIANENRLRQLTRDQTDADGGMRGFGLAPDNPDVAQLTGLVEALARLEHEATLHLQRTLRKHPLGPWQKGARGVGEKQGARLLAAIGDPYWNTLHNRPRTVSELWAYSGLHVLPASQMTSDAQPPHAGREPTGNPDQPSRDVHMTFVGVAAKRRKGQKNNWSGTAKMRAYLVAESCMKAGGPYRAAYDTRRAHTAITHPDWTPGHSHNDALRITAKAVLKDMWIEARRIHGHDTADSSLAA